MTVAHNRGPSPLIYDTTIAHARKRRPGRADAERNRERMLRRARRVRRVAEDLPDEHSQITGATPHSLRRGMISPRISAGQYRQAIAKQCGTSVEMLERDYSFAIEDLENEGPKPAAEEERIRAPGARSGR